jgi:hypothetical protein
MMLMMKKSGILSDAAEAASSYQDATHLPTMLHNQMQTHHMFVETY